MKLTTLKIKGLATVGFKGQTIILVGAMGSGKTTCLSWIAYLLQKLDFTARKSLDVLSMNESHCRRLITCKAKLTPITTDTQDEKRNLTMEYNRLTASEFAQDAIIAFNVYGQAYRFSSNQTDGLPKSLKAPFALLHCQMAMPIAVNFYGEAFPQWRALEQFVKERTLLEWSLRLKLRVRLGKSTDRGLWFVNRCLKRFFAHLKEKPITIEGVLSFPSIATTDDAPLPIIKSEMERVTCSVVANGKKIIDLSSSERRLTTLVVSIAMAIFAQNPDGCKIGEGTGVVLIDEIERHLDVEVQRKILTALEKTFTGVQFIVSTHSPIIIAGRDEQVTLMNKSR